MIEKGLCQLMNPKLFGELKTYKYALVVFVIEICRVKILYGHLNNAKPRSGI